MFRMQETLGDNLLFFYRRDEEKKQGTLIKEEFERPNRENTTVSCDESLDSFSADYELARLVCSHGSWS